MNTVKHVEKLWSELQETLNSTHSIEYNQNLAALSEYRELSSVNALRTLLQTEIRNERKHRGMMARSYPYPVALAAKIIILENVARGAKHGELLPARLWLEIRHSAAEAMTIGNLLGARLTVEWRCAAEALDYSGLMNP